MRLKPSVAKIIKALLTTECPKGCTFFLFGSRTRESARGGDIDLLCLAPGESALSTLKSNKQKILVKLQKAIGEERRIDIIFAIAGTENSDAFLMEIFPSAIEL